MPYVSIFYADCCLPSGRPMMELWRHSFYCEVLELSTLFALPPSLLTSTGNRAICNVPIPQCPLKHLQMYSAPICHCWECGGVSSYVPTSTDGTTPPPPVTPLPYYTFISLAWWIMMILLPYLDCSGSHTYTSVAHSHAFIYSVVARTDLYAPLWCL